MKILLIFEVIDDGFFFVCWYIECFWVFEGGGVRLGGVESEGLDPRKGIFFNSFSKIL